MKLHLLDLGRLDYDEGFPLAGGGVSTASEPNPHSPRRRVAIIGALVEHPKIGPVLFDTGAPPNFKELWPPVVQELFAITRYETKTASIVPSKQLDTASMTSERSCSRTCTLTTPAASSSSAAAMSPSTCMLRS
jgi:hypothetical protein